MEKYVITPAMLKWYLQLVAQTDLMLLCNDSDYERLMENRCDEFIERFQKNLRNLPYSEHLRLLYFVHELALSPIEIQMN